MADSHRTRDSICAARKEPGFLKICPRCNVEFRSASRDSKFCSRQCVEDNTRAKARLQDVNCTHCAKLFRPRGWRYSKFCSRECAFAYEKVHGRDWIPGWKERRQAEAAAKLKRIATCDVCGSAFFGLKVASRLCGNDCRMEDNRRRANAAYALSQARKGSLKKQCMQCGAPFEVERLRGSSARRLCLGCAKSNTSKRNRETNSIRHRAHHYNVPYFRVRHEDVVKLHGRKCWICRKKIPENLSSPNPQSFTLDHVVPLSLGGWHHISNVKPAHMICNSIKSDRYSGQLMLLNVPREGIPL